MAFCPPEEKVPPVEKDFKLEVTCSQFMQSFKSYVNHPDADNLHAHRISAASSSHAGTPS